MNDLGTMISVEVVARDGISKAKNDCNVQYLNKRVIKHGAR